MTPLVRASGSTSLFGYTKLYDLRVHRNTHWHTYECAHSMTAHTHTPATFFFLSCTQTRALILRFMKSKLALKLRLKTMLFIVWFYTCHLFLQTNKLIKVIKWQIYIYIYICVCVCVCVCVTLDRQTEYLPQKDEELLLCMFIRAQ